MARMYALGTSVGKVGKVFEHKGAGQPSKDFISHICVALDAGVAEPHSCYSYHPHASPYLLIGINHAPHCRHDRRTAPMVVTAITVGEDGTRRIVDLTHADTEGLASWKGFLCDLRERSLSGR